MREATRKRSACRTRRRRSGWASILLFATTAVLLPLPTARQSPLGPLEEFATEAAPPPPRELPLEEYQPVAVALRRRDLDATRSALSAVAAALPAEADRAQLILALGELELGDPSAALHTLVAREGAVAGLEDLRLAALCNAATSAGEAEIAIEALRQMLDRHAGSAWTRRLSLEQAIAAAERGDRALARELLDGWRESAGEPTAESEALAFRLAEQSGDRLALVASGRWLLAESPVQATAMSVAARLFGSDENGIGTWGLSSGEMLRRAGHLLDAGRGADAALALAAVPPEVRATAWTLLGARRLALDGHLEEARETLETVSPSSGSELAEVAARRADLLLSIARQRGGRQTAEQRAAQRREARQQLLLAARWGGRSELALRSWRRLSFELAREEELELALAVLRTLRRLSPTDRSGVENLWRVGWSAFERGANDEAIATFATLEDLYPDVSEARWAKYWRARALNRLGQIGRAQELLQELAASPSGDFYRHHARTRLRQEAPPSPLLEETVQWPHDPSLQRARNLLDVGLLATAQEELSLCREEADPRAAAALEAEILAAQGSIRSSIRPLLQAFPELGTTRQDGLPRRALELYYPLAHRQEVTTWAARYRLPLPLVLAMIRQESAFDLSAASGAGARGLMQLMPATARELARKLSLAWRTDRLDDPSFSVRLGTAYFRQVLTAFDGDLELALAGYNCGPNRVRRWWGRERSGERDRFIEGFPLSETRSYVKRVLLLADSYRRLYPDLG